MNRKRNKTTFKYKSQGFNIEEGAIEILKRYAYLKNETKSLIINRFIYSLRDELTKLEKAERDRQDKEANDENKN